MESRIKDKIMVIGGYGKVGKYICKTLLSRGETVVVAGRSIERCQQFALNEEKEIECRYVDVTQWKDDYLDEIQTVVMALEMNNMQVLEACIRCKVNYVDITPTGALLDKMEKKRNEIEQAGIIACIGVGIAPGVSNVLCEHLAGEFEEISEINSYLMLGIGEEHGANAVSWLVDNLNVAYYENMDKNRMVHSFSDGRNILLDGERRKRRYVRVDLADWHIMKRKHPEAVVNSWYAYDKNSITYFFEVLQKLKILKLLKYAKVKSFLLKFMKMEMNFMQKIHFGTDQYAIMVEVKGKRNGKAETKRDMISGRINSEITGKVCGLTAQKLIEKNAGLYYMDEVLCREEFCEN